MAFYKLGCLGRYDFDKIIDSAYKRFVEGMPLAALIRNARSAREKEEVTLITNVDVTPILIRHIRISCKHCDQCTSRNCDSILQRLLEIRTH